jgi:hypothetical protein
VVRRPWPSMHMHQRQDQGRRVVAPRDRYRVKDASQSTLASETSCARRVGDAARASRADRMSRALPDERVWLAVSTLTLGLTASPVAFTGV